MYAVSRTALPFIVEKMPAKIFVGNLPYGVMNDTISRLFEPYGVVTECAVLGNFGFVVSLNMVFPSLHID